MGQTGRQRTGRPRGRVAGACRRHPAARTTDIPTTPTTQGDGKKRPEARSWCERRHLNKGYVLRKKGKPDPTPARVEKRTASRYYQLKSGHALTGVYLKSTDNRSDDHCWWCDPENISGTQQSRDHLFKHLYDAECAAIACALDAAAAAQTRPGSNLHGCTGRVKTDDDDEPGPGQTCALQARQAISLRKREPAVEIEIRWCPAHKGSPEMR